MVDHSIDPDYDDDPLEENRRLRRALEPFAKAANFFELQHLDDTAIVLLKPSESGLSGALTMADLRRARDTLV